MTLFARSTGDTIGAAPLVLLHGFGGGAFVWQRAIAALDGAVPILAYDLPGHGGSLDDAGIGGAGPMAKSILADLDARGIHNFHVAGHSMGGAVAALLALRQPERVLSMLLLAPGGFGPQLNHDALAAYASAETSDELRRALRPMIGTSAKFPDDILSAMIEQRRHASALPALRLILDAMFVDRSVAAPQQGVLPLAQLGALPMPKQILWGEDDRIVPIPDVSNLPPGLAVVRLPGAGHMLIEECPDIVLAAVRAMLTASASKTL